MNMFEFIKAVSITVFDVINAAYCDKPLIFIVAMFPEKLVSNHRAVNQVDSCLLMWSVGSKLWNLKEIALHWAFEDGRCETSKDRRSLVS